MCLCVYVPGWCPLWSEEGAGSLGIEVIDAGNQMLVLCKSSKCSLPLVYLSNPSPFPLLAFNRNVTQISCWWLTEIQ